MNIKLKRAYEEADSSDGIRILVGTVMATRVTKTAAALDHWFKDIAPSPELRNGSLTGGNAGVNFKNVTG